MKHKKVKLQCGKLVDLSLSVRTHSVDMYRFKKTSAQDSQLRPDP